MRNTYGYVYMDMGVQYLVSNTGPDDASHGGGGAGRGVWGGRGGGGGRGGRGRGWGGNRAQSIISRSTFDNLTSGHGLLTQTPKK